ncbi:MAG TPA: class I SAM-dependent methyltransferase [Solirubrobacterales bacterium]|nr:class I SAM-dependent methyltransferase [Solirubrobacterales bacterium]
MSSPPLTPLATATLAVGRPESALVVECGDGDAALFLAREFPQARVRGVDTDEGAIRRATARIGLDPEGRIAFKVGGPRALPFPDDHFDLVAVLDGRLAAAETARVLRPGGFLVIAYSERLHAPSKLGSRLGEWRFSRQGFVAVESEEAGDGSFSVARLGKADRSRGAE